MPVQLPKLIIDPSPQPPRPVPWLIFSMVVMVVGVIWGLETWPKDEPTDTAKFWVHILVEPALACVIIFGLRLFYYDDESARLQAEREVHEEDTAEAITFAQEPLAVLACSSICIFDDEAAKRVAARESLLEARRPAHGKVPVRHTALHQFEHASLTERYRQCFSYLLGQVEEALRTLPASMPLSVYLQLPSEVAVAEVRAAWQACWQAAGLRAVEVTCLQPQEGVMMLDAWLDLYGGPELEKVALIIAAQMHEVTEANSAEAAAALLLGWAPLLSREGLTTLALVHRPVEDVEENVSDAMSRAVLWGSAQASAIQHLWQAGLAQDNRTAVNRAASHVALGLVADAAKGTHDVDAAMGQPGIASDWFATVLAVEHAVQTQTPQLVAARQHTLRLGVVRPQATT